MRCWAYGKVTSLRFVTPCQSYNIATSQFKNSPNVLPLLRTLYVALKCEIHVHLHSPVVDCGTLTNPANGQVIHTGGTTFGETATYSCNTGYRLVGSSIRTCLVTRGWSGSIPTCQCMLLFTLEHIKK